MADEVDEIPQALKHALKGASRTYRINHSLLKNFEGNVESTHLLYCNILSISSARSGAAEWHRREGSHRIQSIKPKGAEMWFQILETFKLYSNLSCWTPARPWILRTWLLLIKCPQFPKGHFTHCHLINLNTMCMCQQLEFYSSAGCIMTNMRDTLQ